MVSSVGRDAIGRKVCEVARQGEWPGQGVAIGSISLRWVGLNCVLRINIAFR